MTSRHIYFERANQILPGGVNSPVRAFRSVGGEPPFITKAYGAYLEDTEGKRYIDYVGSWGPMIAGHAHPAVIHAVQTTAAQGLSFGAPTVMEIELAEKIQQHLPSMEMLRFVNSGTEATMSAIRLARGFTGKSHIIKFNGCYHGHSDGLLVKAGSGALTFGVPDSAGVPTGYAQYTLVAEYNDLESVERYFAQHPNDIAAIIIEPIAGNMNLIMPQPEFLPGLRQLCDRYQSLLIFDEVMTGFRVALGGAQTLYSIHPDLTTLGKIIGGGMPVGAFGGRKEIMQKIAPLGPVYQAGTLSGNPVAMAAGLATLDLLEQPKFHERLQQKTHQLMTGLQRCAQQAGISLLTQYVTGMFGLFFTDQSHVNNFAAVQHCHISRFRAFFHSMLYQGIYLAPSAYEAGFISQAHEDVEIQTTLTAARTAFQHIADHPDLQ